MTSFYDQRYRQALRDLAADANPLQCSLDRKNKTITKFGRTIGMTADVSTTIAYLGNGIEFESYSTTNDITHVASEDSGDTQEIRVEGHTIDGSNNLTFVVQFVTLTGQTPVALETALARCNRLNNLGATDIAGPVWVQVGDTFTAGVPDTAANVRATIPSGRNNSQKAATSISQHDAFLITQIGCTVQRQANANVDVELEIRQLGSVFREAVPIGSQSRAGTTIVDLAEAVIVRPNSDIRMVGISTASSTNCSAWFSGRLATIIE